MGRFVSAILTEIRVTSAIWTMSQLAKLAEEQGEVVRKIKEEIKDIDDDEAQKLAAESKDSYDGGF